MILLISALVTSVRLVATNVNHNLEMSEISLASDDSWEDWSVVTAYCYNLDGQKVSGAFYGCQVQRRMSCGEREYRIHIPNSGWYPVSKSPISGYSYCVYYSDYVYCFNM